MRRKNDELASTAAVGIAAVAHKGGLLGRYVRTGGILIGQTVIVSERTRCVVVGGDQVTDVLQEGLHLLELKHFNRQPAAFLYTVSAEPDPVSWFPYDTSYRRSLALFVVDPVLFVQKMVIELGFEQSDEVLGYLSRHIDRAIPPGQLHTVPQSTHTAMITFMEQHGLSLVTFDEAQAAAAPPPPPPRPE